MWNLEDLLTREGTTPIDKAAIALAKAVRDFSREPTRGHLQTVLSAIHRAENSVIGFKEYDCREFFSATKQLMGAYGRRAVHFSNNPDSATRERATAFVQEFVDVAGHIFRELEAIDKLAAG